MSWLSKMSSAEEKARDLRKGLLEQRSRPAASKVKPVLLEYEVPEHAVTEYYHTRAGWVKQGRYKSKAQALRVIAAVVKKPYSRVSVDWRWRIDGELVEGL